MTKVTLLYGHPKDPQAFEQYYKEKHLPLASKIGGVERLELTRFERGENGNAPVYYRMAELYFPNEEQLQSSLRSPKGRSAVSDFPNFATGGVTMLIGDVDR